MLLFYIVLFSLVLGFVHCKMHTTCSSAILPKGPTAQQLTAGSPYKYYWTFGPPFVCYQIIYMNPRFGYNNYSGSLLLTNIDSQIRIAEYVANPNKNEYVITGCTMCGNFSKIVYHSVAYKVTSHGSYFCFSQCDGAKFIDFNCYSNTNKFANEMQEVVNSIRRVPNGYKIRQTDCPYCPTCSFFN